MWSYPLEANGKTCSRCKKFKSASEFYKQGHRLESLCKPCKCEARRNKNSQENTLKQESSAVVSDSSQSAANFDVPREFQTYEDLGFTKEEFLEIADFFRELIRLSKKGKIKNE